jgi:hypothetical protein
MSDQVYDQLRAMGLLREKSWHGGVPPYLGPKVR